MVSVQRVMIRCFLLWKGFFGKICQALMVGLGLKSSLPTKAIP